MTDALREKKSYQQALYRYVMLFILLPLLGSAIYLLYSNYQSSVIQARQRVDETADSTARSITLALAALRMQLEESRSEEALGEVVTNIMYHQFAAKRLEDMVTNSPLIKAAFIQDDAGFIVSGFPLATLALQSPAMTRVTADLIKINPIRAKNRLFLFEDVKSRAGDVQDSPPSTAIYFGIPMQVKAVSLMNPHRITSILWVQIDTAVLLSQSLGLEADNKTGHQLFADRRVLSEIGTHEETAKQIAAAATLGITAWRDGRELSLHYKTEHLQSSYTRDARILFINGSLAMLLASLILLLAMRRFARTLNQPLQLLIEYSRDISAGDYKHPPASLDFEEFDELRQAMAKMATTIKEHVQLLEKQANTDVLSGLYNRRMFREIAEKEMLRCQRSSHPENRLWLISLDIDFFKKVNDTAGHAMGDRVIQAVAATLNRTVRGSDTAARVGGEEYCILLPDCTATGTRRIADAILSQVEQLHIPGWTDQHGPVTVSIGCACNQGKSTFDELSSAADNALYDAKHNGRNQVVFESKDRLKVIDTVQTGQATPSAVRA